MVRELEVESAERLGLPAIGRGESKASRVHDRDDGDRHAGVGQVRAAGAAVVSQLDAQEVLVGDKAGVGRALDTSHHKGIFGGDLLLDAVLLLCVGHVVADGAEVHHQFGLPASLPESGPSDFAVDEVGGVGIGVVAESALTKGHSLLNEEFNLAHVEGTLGVVDVDCCARHFLGREDVLLKGAPHGRGALVDTAPGGHLRGLLLHLSDLKGQWGLADD